MSTTTRKKSATKTSKSLLKAKTKKLTKKTPAKKKTSKKIPKISKSYTKSELFAAIAERVDLPKKNITHIFDEFYKIIAAHFKKGAIEKFVLPGMLKVTVKKVPAKKARKGINPFTGEEMIFKAKPASKKIKILPLKTLKEMVA